MLRPIADQPDPGAPIQVRRAVRDDRPQIDAVRALEGAGAPAGAHRALDAREPEAPRRSTLAVVADEVKKLADAMLTG